MLFRSGFQNQVTSNVQHNIAENQSPNSGSIVQQVHSGGFQSCGGVQQQQLYAGGFQSQSSGNASQQGCGFQSHGGGGSVAMQQVTQDMTAEQILSSLSAQQSASTNQQQQNVKTKNNFIVVILQC